MIVVFVVCNVLFCLFVRLLPLSRPMRSVSTFLSTSFLLLLVRLTLPLNPLFLEPRLVLFPYSVLFRNRES